MKRAGIGATSFAGSTDWPVSQPSTSAYAMQGNESRLTRLWLQRAENVQEVLRVPGGALAAALD